MAVISVLIPVHNAAPWLESALHSVRNQTYRNLEILVYDDGSTDQSLPIAKRMAAEDSRLLVLGESSNRGIVHALNSMLHRAQGEFIARMDADDICLPERFERQLHFLATDQVDLCGTWFQEFGDGIARSVRWNSSSVELQAAMLFQNTICHPTVMARREVFDASPYREGYKLAEDYDLFVRALSRFRLANVPEVLLRYRRHRQQATNAKRFEMEQVTRRIRIEALDAQGIVSTPDEQRVHNLIRAPHSITAWEDLERIEQWLIKLLEQFDHPDALRVVASQWTRAAVRAAPLGWSMWRKYRESVLHAQLGATMFNDLDLAVLAALRLNYRSRAFESLRRMGLSA